MSQRSIGAFVLAVGWATPACGDMAFAQASSTSNGSKVVQGRCHMDVCSWFRVKDRDTVQTNPLGSLVRITLETGESSPPNASYNRKTPIEWSQAATAYVFCSKAQPAVIFDNDGKWEAATLSPGHLEGVFGY